MRRPLTIVAGALAAVAGLVGILTLDGVLGAAAGGAVCGLGVALLIEGVRGPRRRGAERGGA